MIKGNYTFWALTRTLFIKPWRVRRRLRLLSPCFPTEPAWNIRVVPLVPVFQISFIQPPPSSTSCLVTLIEVCYSQGTMNEMWHWQCSDWLLNQEWTPLNRAHPRTCYLSYNITGPSKYCQYHMYTNRTLIIDCLLASCVMFISIYVNLFTACEVSINWWPLSERKHTHS